MVEPVTVMALVNASLGIARSLGHTIKELYEIAEAYEMAALSIRTVATQCNSFRIAVQRISKWLETQDEGSRKNLDEDFWQALTQNLETAGMVMDDLDKRIVNFKKTPTKFWTRTKFLWNGAVIAELQSQIGGLISAVSILVQVIDIPTTGGKRSYSLAHRNRLNNLTKSVRHNVDEERARIRARQEQNLLGDAVTDTGLPVLEHARTEPGVLEPAETGDDNMFATTRPSAPLRAHTASDTTELSSTQNETQSRQLIPPLGDLAVPDTAPPPYESTDGIPRTDEGDSQADKRGRTKSPSEGKTKRTFWRTGKVSKTDVTSGFTSIFSKSKSQPAAPQSFVVKSQSTTVDDKIESTILMANRSAPAAAASQSADLNAHTTTPQFSPTTASTDTLGDREHAELQLAMSSVGLKSDDITSIEKDTVQPKNSVSMSPVESSKRTETPESLIRHQSGDQSYFERSLPLPPRRNTAPWTQNATAGPETKPSYHSQIPSPSERYEKPRPSQRVKESREQENPRSRESIPQVSSNDNPQQTKSNNNLSSPYTPSSTNIQTWITYPMPSQRIRFRIEFLNTSFTNKISASGARTLGIEDSIIDYAGIPTTALTMLSMISNECVTGDEVEFVVMDEHEQRTPCLILGAGLAYLKGLMEEGEYVYWDSRPVPDRLRTVERLRLFRRFELVRW